MRNCSQPNRDGFECGRPLDAQCLCPIFFIAHKTSGGVDEFICDIFTVLKQKQKKLEKILIYLQKGLWSNDFGVLPVGCSTVMELWYWQWPDGDIPEAPQLSPSYLVGPHSVIYNTGSKYWPRHSLLCIRNSVSPTQTYIQTWLNDGYCEPTFKEAAVYSV